jgi:type IV pilus assembly protein PilW
MSNHQQGFTFIEWLISLSIGLILLTFASKLYINLQKTAYFTQASFEIYENESIAFAWLARDIRMAGFIGCPNLADVSIADKEQLLIPAVIGWHQGVSSSGSLFPIQKALKTSDVLCLEYADPNRTEIISAQAGTIRFVKKPPFSQEAILLLSDCRHAEVLQLGHMQLKHRYANDAMISPFYRIAYFVASTGRKNLAKQPIYALYRQDLNAPTHPTELVENIEKLEVHYGTLTDQGVLQYVTANHVKRWEQVRSITVVLHFSSTDNAIHTPSAAKPLPRRLTRTTQQTTMIRGRNASYRLI